ADVAVPVLDDRQLVQRKRHEGPALGPGASTGFIVTALTCTCQRGRVSRMNGISSPSTVASFVGRILLPSGRAFQSAPNGPQRRHVANARRARHTAASTRRPARVVIVVGGETP